MKVIVFQVKRLLGFVQEMTELFFFLINKVYFYFVKSYFKIYLIYLRTLHIDAMIYSVSK